MERRKTRQVTVGSVLVGGDAPISIQSMTKTKTDDIDSTVAQIHELEEAGCDIARVAVPDEKAANALAEIRRQTTLPLVSDIHFNYRYALTAVEAGFDKIRINPGNIGSDERVRMVLDACKERGVPIRIGVNAGSLERDIMDKYGYPTVEGMVESALRHVGICEDAGFEDIIISMKASDVHLMIRAYRALSEQVDYPLHLGVTETGTLWAGTIKSAVGMGTLLSEGIGDTIRVSLVANPVEEIRVGREILRSLHLKSGGVNIIACPTCGRIDVNLEKMVDELEQATSKVKKSLNVAVMGCAVNGPGEASDADLGVACGDGKGLIYKKGEKLCMVEEDKIIEKLVEEIHAWEED